MRGAYGLLGREVIQALKHLQHAPGKTVIFVGVLEKVTDEFNTVTWQPQMEGTKAGARAARHRRPGDLDAPVLAATPRAPTCSTSKPTERRLVCKAGNPYGLPAKDRSGRLDMTEPPDLGRLLAKINTAVAAPARGRNRLTPSNRKTPMYDLNDAQPQMPPVGELIPDGTFARVAMTIRPGGLNGATPADAGLLKASNSSDAKLLDCEFTVVEGPYARRKFWQNFTVAGGKVDEKGQSKGWNIAKSAFRAMIDSALGLEPQGRERRREAEAGDPGAEAARRHRLRRPHHDRAGVEPAIQGRQQARQRGDAGRAAVRRRHARRERAARAGQRQAAQGRGGAVTAPAWATPAAAAPESQVPWAAGASGRQPRSNDRASSRADRRTGLAEG